MFKEYVELIDEAVDEGMKRGIDLFLENLNQDMVIDELTESCGGSDQVLKQIFESEGYSVTDLESIEEGSELDAKLDYLLDQLKKEKIVA